VKKSDIRKQAGQPLWARYASLEEALRDLYPEYPWDSFKFVRTAGFWHAKDNTLQFISSAEHQLDLQQVRYK